jgi:hypothetical protein
MFDTKAFKSATVASKRFNLWVAHVADDAALPAQSGKKLQVMMMDAFYQAATVFGLATSINKSEVLTTKDDDKVTEGIRLKHVDGAKGFEYIHTGDCSSDYADSSDVQLAQRSVAVHVVHTQAKEPPSQHSYRL